MIVCNNLTKKYKDTMALADVSLQLDKGVYGLIGENGAGKSTLFRLLIGQSIPDKGSVLIDGKEAKNGKSESRIWDICPRNLIFSIIYRSIKAWNT